MALSRDKKNEIVADISELLNSSKMTVVASYPGTGVKAMQTLRKSADENGTVVRVVKNRLVAKALGSNETFKDTDTNQLKGQLLYAFNPNDEVGAAQALANFAKQQPTIEFVGAIDGLGNFVSAEDVKVLANLPSQEVLRAQLVGVFKAPLNGLASVLGGNLQGLLRVLDAKAQASN